MVCGGHRTAPHLVHLVLVHVRHEPLVRVAHIIRLVHAQHLCGGAHPRVCVRPVSSCGCCYLMQKHICSVAPCNIGSRQWRGATPQTYSAVSADAHTHTRTLSMVDSLRHGSSMRSTSPRTHATAPECGALFLATMGRSANVWKMSDTSWRAGGVWGGVSVRTL